MSRIDFLSSLNLVTLIIVVAIAAIGLALFLRRRRNRHPLDGRAERNVAADLDAGRAAPDHSPRV
jgi:LPXTG-motif cell wall-anchored protein